jgi:hypothetical protein
MATDTKISIELSDGLDYHTLEVLTDSVWYDGHVFTVTDTETNTSLSVSAVGEVRIHDSRKKYEGNLYRSGYDLKTNGNVHTDRHLNFLLKKNLLEFHNNNWFECFADWGDDFDFLDCVTHSPKEALAHATDHLLAFREELKNSKEFNDNELWER